MFYGIPDTKKMYNLQILDPDTLEYFHKTVYYKIPRWYFSVEKNNPISFVRIKILNFSYYHQCTYYQEQPTTPIYFKYASNMTRLETSDRLVPTLLIDGPSQEFILNQLEQFHNENEK